MLQSKDIEWQIGEENKSLQDAACKRPTLGQRTHIDWNLRAGKRYFMQMEMTRKQGYQYSDKIDFILFFFKFSFGCVGSSLLHAGFL